MTIPFATFAAFGGSGRTSAVDLGYQVSNSLWIPDTERLEENFTASGGTSGTFFTWYKKGEGTYHGICFSQPETNDYTFVDIDELDKLEVVTVTGGATEWRWTSDFVLRDPTATYQIIVAIDPSQGTNADRINVFVNGVDVTSQGTISATITNNYLFRSGANNQHLIGYSGNGNVNGRGYYAQTGYLDGTFVTDPASAGLGEFDATGERWRAVDVSGLTFGSGGFLLLFDDNSTTTTLVADQSGNGNDFTVTAGIATTDQSTDTPSNNHCTLNPLDTGSGTLSEGNLVSTGTTDRSGTIAVESGKNAWKVTADAAGNFGVVANGLTGTETTYAASLNDELEFELDADADTLSVRVNGGAPSSVGTGLTGPYLPLVKAACTCDFGQNGFTPTDSTFKTLSTTNLPERTVTDLAEYYASGTFTKSTSTHAVTGLNFNPSTDGCLLVVKRTDSGGNWYIGSTVLGAGEHFLGDVNTSGQVTDANGIVSYDSDGFTVGSTLANGDYYYEVYKISSGRFAVDLYSGDDTSNRNVSHTLGAVPSRVLCVRLDAAEDRFVYHQDLSGTDYFLLHNSNVAESNANSPWGTGNWTSSQVMVTNNATNNANASGTDNYLLITWAECEIYRHGVYQGNGDADGPYIGALGAVVSTTRKRQSSTGSWTKHDDARLPNNVRDGHLYLDSAIATATGIHQIDFVAQGAKLRASTAGTNGIGEGYIYQAVVQPEGSNTNPNNAR